MIGRQGEDSCGGSGTGETPQERKRRGGSPAAQGNQLRCHKRFSLCIPFVGLSMSFLSLCLTLIFFISIR
ncbi:hypothetical protein [Priestia aryabhattai]|uniref:hypothetical protein n=1 Tax=Priestia aryabhattai TaxID=412384 RepID=UPI002E21A0F3|nr:hypothetical protein [Priestia aryabhattai]